MDAPSTTEVFIFHTYLGILRLLETYVGSGEVWDEEGNGGLALLSLPLQPIDPRFTVGCSPVTH